MMCHADTYCDTFTMAVYGTVLCTYCVINKLFKYENYRLDDPIFVVYFIFALRYESLPKILKLRTNLNKSK